MRVMFNGFVEWAKERLCPVRNEKNHQFSFGHSLLVHPWSCSAYMNSMKVFSRERFTTVTAYRGSVTKSQFLEKLITGN